MVHFYHQPTSVKTIYLGNIWFCIEKTSLPPVAAKTVVGLMG